MPYTFKPDHALSRDIREIASRQLALALGQLNPLEGPCQDDAIHEARRHLKKTVALLRLVDPSPASAEGKTLARTRVASRLLGPVADAEALVGATQALTVGPAPRAGRAVVAVLRTGLLLREARIDRKAAVDNLLPKVTRMLGFEQRRVATWKPRAAGFDALASGLERTVRRARRAMKRTAEGRRRDCHHDWRRRVKELWFQVRLLQPRTGAALTVTCAGLEELDGLLGEHHNLLLLEEALLTEPLLPRAATARCLRAARARRAELSRKALALGARVLRARPRDFVRKVARAWRTRARVARTSNRSAR